MIDKYGFSVCLEMFLRIESALACRLEIEKEYRLTVL